MCCFFARHAPLIYLMAIYWLMKFSTPKSRVQLLTNHIMLSKWNWHNVIIDRYQGETFNWWTLSYIHVNEPINCHKVDKWCMPSKEATHYLFKSVCWDNPGSNPRYAARVDSSKCFTLVSINNYIMPISFRKHNVIGQQLDTWLRSGKLHQSINRTTIQTRPLPKTPFEPQET
jgi:hypothetical protein